MATKYVLRRGKSVLSSSLHVILNLILSFGSIASVILSGSWVIGIILVIISKWRIFAVRPRFWWANIKANLIDLIVGSSFVLLSYASYTTTSTLLWIHLILAICYALWLIFLKPKSSVKATTIQALIAVFLGSNTATIMLGATDSLWLTLSMFIIGYAATRHVLIQNDEEDFFLFSFLVGLLFAELGWLCHSWLIVYTIPSTGIIISQLSLILSIFAFVLSRIYKSIFRHDGKLKISDVAISVIFSIIMIGIIIIGYSKPIFNI